MLGGNKRATVGSHCFMAAAWGHWEHFKSSFFSGQFSGEARVRVRAACVRLFRQPGLMLFLLKLHKYNSTQIKVVPEKTLIHTWLSTAAPLTMSVCVLVWAVPIKVVNILDVAKESFLILGAQSQSGLVRDVLQVVLPKEESLLKLWKSRIYSDNSDRQSPPLDHQFLKTQSRIRLHLTHPEWSVTPQVSDL